MTIEAKPAIFGIMRMPVGLAREFPPEERLSVVAKGSSTVVKLEVSVDKDGLINTEGQKLNHSSGAGALRKPMLYRWQINEAHLRLVPEKSSHGIKSIISHIAPEMVYWRRTA